MKLNPLLVGLAVAVTVALLIIFLSGDDSNSCKDTSRPVGQYNTCIAVQRCKDQFPSNSELRFDCMTQVYYNIYK